MAKNAFEPKAKAIALNTAVETLRQNMQAQVFSSTSFDDTPADIVVDSRKLKVGCIFLAISGSKSDGHDYIEAAVLARASLLICERKPETDPGEVPYIVVSSSRAAWAWLCAAAWDHPEQKLKFFGVTGTNGKTSCVWMLREILTAHNLASASIGTLGYFVKETYISTQHTTPDPDVLYGLFHLAVSQGCSHVVMEVSSHAIVQEKLAPVRFDGAAFTSFSQDHLDFHKTMEDYLAAKLRLFQLMLKPDACAVMHADVYRLAKDFLPNTVKIITYGPQEDPNSKNLGVQSQLDSSRCNTRVTLTFNQLAYATTIPFIGHIFAENFAAAAMLSLKALPDSSLETILDLKGRRMQAVPGRLTPLKSSKLGRPLVLVDYAHTPDALFKALSEARKVTSKRLIVVFGCGGDRDKLKRPMMGETAEKLSDLVIITNDNPRSEKPEDIAQDILVGLRDTAKAVVELDRRMAITKAVTEAVTGDTVLIAGKGHETDQIIAGKTLHFSDEEEARVALDQRRIWCVLGCGVSGRAAAMRLRSEGDDVVISDAHKVSSSVKEDLGKAKITVFDGGHDITHLAHVSSLILSPGVASDNILYEIARTRHLGTATEIDLGLEGFEGQMIAITGTNGKSTTCAMLEHALNAAGETATACGNIGLPPSALPTQLKTKNATLVCELSSYQLEQSSIISSDVAMITSFSFDHIARHGSLEAYFACKWRAALGVKRSGLLLLRGDAYGEAKRLRVPRSPAKTITIHDAKPSFTFDHEDFGEHWWLGEDSSSIVDASGFLFSLTEVSLPGIHNRINAAFATAAMSHLLRIPLMNATKYLVNFSGLPYRCQRVGLTKLGRPIFNDSKSTNVESTLVALTAAEGPLLLLLGGAGKGESFRAVRQHAAKIHTVFAFGASRLDIANDLSKDLRVLAFATLEEACDAAKKISSETPVSVLLSPGCASFDEFKNYEDRGAKFNQWLLS